MAALGAYRALYLINWIFRYFTEEDYLQRIVWVAGVVQVRFFLVACGLDHLFDSLSLIKWLCLCVCVCVFAFVRRACTATSSTTTIRANAAA